MSTDWLAEAKARLAELRLRELQLAAAKAETPPDEKHIFACQWRRNDALGDVYAQAPDDLARCFALIDEQSAEIAALLAEADRLKEQNTNLRKRAPTEEECTNILGAGNEAVYDGWNIQRCRSCGTIEVEGHPVCARCADAAKRGEPKAMRNIRCAKCGRTAESVAEQAAWIAGFLAMGLETNESADRCCKGGRHEWVPTPASARMTEEAKP